MQLTETAQSVVWADPNGYLANVVQQLQIAWPHNRTINLVFHGGDVPAGYAATPVVDTFNAYPHLLHTALKEKYPNAVINIIITAGGGEASDGGAKRFARDVLNHNPDVIFLDYGLNDRRIGLQEAEKAWSLMIKQAKAQNVPVVLLTPTADVHADIQNPNDLLCKHALQIRKLAVLNEVALIDSLRRFTEYVRQGGNLEDLMSQSGHPNRKGHELVAAELAKWFSPNPPSKSEN
jgi:lysophospholipase L1-like esterase